MFFPMVIRFIHHYELSIINSKERQKIVDMSAVSTYDSVAMTAAHAAGTA